MGQMEQDQRLPFAPEYEQGCVQAAGKGVLFHPYAIPIHARVGAYQKVHTGT
jgi:hypothetical protein